MLHKGTFCQVLACLPRKNRSWGKKINVFEIKTDDPSIYTMDHPDSLWKIPLVLN